MKKKNSIRRKLKEQADSIQGRLSLEFEYSNPNEPILLVCGHTTQFKNVSKFGYGWCPVCGSRMAKMY